MICPLRRLWGASSGSIQNLDFYAGQCITGWLRSCQNGPMPSRNNRVAEILERRRLAGDLRAARAGVEQHLLETIDPLEATITVAVPYLNSGEPFTLPLLSSITDDLWIGGVSAGLILPERFVHVVSLHPWLPYFVNHPIRSVHAMPMADSDELPDLAMLEALARLVNVCRRDGVTLVHCQVGLNRSALLAGLALVRDGTAPATAISLMREQRSEHVLCNAVFEAWLRRQGSGADGFEVV
jgi:hypothetical protein